jgi:hypothetical protein
VSYQHDQLEDVGGNDVVVIAKVKWCLIFMRLKQTTWRYFFRNWNVILSLSLVVGAFHLQNKIRELGTNLLRIVFVWNFFCCIGSPLHCLSWKWSICILLSIPYDGCSLYPHMNWFYGWSGLRTIDWTWFVTICLPLLRHVGIIPPTPPFVNVSHAPVWPHVSQVRNMYCI